MVRYRFLFIFLSILLAGFFCAFLPLCHADGVDEISETSAPPVGVAPVPSDASGGSVPKTAASPATAGTPAAAASPVASGASVSSSASPLLQMFHPSQWQWPTKFSVTDPGSWPFIPVPEIATDPNGGTTVGILAAVLYTDSKNQITDIFAPDVETNTTLGPGGTFSANFRLSGRTTPIGTSPPVRRRRSRVTSTLIIADGRTRKQWFSFEGRFYFEKDPTERFFGVGNDSRLGNQTNYTTNQIYGLGVFGINFTEDLQLALTVRPRRVRIDRGGFDDVPSIFRLFPRQKGINGGSEVLNQAVFSYDTRDSLQVPRKGGLAVVYFGVADRSLGSSISYTHFGGELRRFYEISEKVTLAGHAYLSSTTSGNETFWSMARLGGQESELTNQETLRGYGAGRFIDNNLAVANGEVRTRVWDHDIFGTHGILELAPFVDIGRVAHNLGFNPLTQPHTVGGIGFSRNRRTVRRRLCRCRLRRRGRRAIFGINYPF